MSKAPAKPKPFVVDDSLTPPYEVTSYVFDLYDGDTIYYHADLGYRTWAMFQSGRLLGINSPEIKAKAKKTRAAAQASKDGLRAMMAKYALNRLMPVGDVQQLDGNAAGFGPSGIYGYKLLIRSLKAPVSHSKGFFDAKKEKYGRWLVVLVGADDAGQPVILNDLMVKQDLAEPYMVQETGKPASTKQLLSNPVLLQKYMRTLNRRSRQ